MATTTPPPTYEPEWNPETETYEDVCPVDPRKSKLYICKCRDDDGYEIRTPTQFRAHFNLKCHQNWRQRFHQVSTYEIAKLQKENEELKKENVIMSIRFDKELAQSKRDFIKLKMDFATYKQKTKGNVYYDADDID